MLKKIAILALAAALSAACSDESPSDAAGVGGAESGGIGGDLTSAGGSTLGTGGLGSGGTASGGAAPDSGGTDAGGDGSGGAELGAGGIDAGGAGGGEASGGATTEMEWLPSWATSIQTSEPGNTPGAFDNKTVRQFVWPTVSGEEIRIQLSNEKGQSPLDIQKVHIAMATGDSGDSGGQIDAATDVPFTFDGMANVTIPAGETVWSDALSFSLEELKLTSISMQMGSGVNTSQITGHPGARTTTYLADGDVVSEGSISSNEKWDRWYFINAVEVMAPADSFAIAVLGDSITDGYGIINEFARWPDFLTLAIQDDPMIADSRSVLNFGMGANNLTITDEYQDAGVLRFERDVLTRDKVKWLIVLEGINDIVSSNVESGPIIEAYQTIIEKARAKGILVYGSPITPNGPSSVRDEVNDWVRTSGEFDEVIDLDEALRDPNNPTSLLPAYNNDDLHPNAAGYKAMGDFVDLSLFYNVKQ